MEIGKQNFFDLVIRFVSLSITYKKYLMERWPDPVTEEWLEALDALEEEIDAREGEAQAGGDEQA